METHTEDKGYVMMTPENCCIVMTACVNPGGMSGTAMQDPEERLAQYASALRFYLDNTEFSVVFCENSGTDLSLAFTGYGDRVEFLTFDGNGYSKERGKGYGEYLILKYIKENSGMFRRFRYFMKITGRMIIANISEFASVRIPDTKEGLCVCQMRNIDNPMPAAIITDRIAYEKAFLEKGWKSDDSSEYYIENAMTDALRLHPEIVLLPVVVPLVTDCVYGYDGNSRYDALFDGLTGGSLTAMMDMYQQTGRDDEILKRFLRANGYEMVRNS